LRLNKKEDGDGLEEGRTNEDKNKDKWDYKFSEFVEDKSKRRINYTEVIKTKKHIPARSTSTR
jgi:hypothetical protein